MTIEPVLATDLDLPGLRRGKVRDVYDLPPDPATGHPRLLIIATDRISAFDVVMPTPIPGKGQLLTSLSTFWLRFIEREGLGPTHLLSTNADDIPEAAFASAGTTRDQLRGRCTIARKARVIPIECVARGYLEGSGWKEYQATGHVCGLPLPPGLRQCDRLPEPIFTPATKEEQGKHDENIDFDRAASLVGRSLMEDLRRRTLAIYRAAAAHALARGIIIADTKFEFGLAPDGSILLIDEALTPDSSRFWPADTYTPGRAQRSFDKQYLREWLEEQVRAGHWNKTPPGPDLPAAIVDATLDRYREARDRLTK
ncbi:MAG: phosphoribosylaminoimidazole-succinocarboxamide synthase [Phycisphaerae bacterium]|nr:MAG: phosphoribosylaminoimidazole-succinocarboxamide synthase [Phycisphaerae bacterium]